MPLVGTGLGFSKEEGGVRGKQVPTFHAWVKKLEEEGTKNLKNNKKKYKVESTNAAPRHTQPKAFERSMVHHKKTNTQDFGGND